MLPKGIRQFPNGYYTIPRANADLEDYLDKHFYRIHPGELLWKHTDAETIYTLAPNFKNKTVIIITDEENIDVDIEPEDILLVLGQNLTTYKNEQYLLCPGGHETLPCITTVENGKEDDYKYHDNLFNSEGLGVIVIAITICKKLGALTVKMPEQLYTRDVILRSYGLTVKTY